MRGDTAYIDWLENLADAETRNAWRDGVWANLSGAIYTYEIVDDLPADAKIRWHGYGQDSGYRDPATVMEVWDVDEVVPTIYVRQILYERGLTNSDFCGRIQGRVPYDAEILCDSADVKQIEELVRSGWRFARGCYPICKKAKEISVKAMKNYRIKVIHNDDYPASDLIRELDTYRYKNDAAGNPTDKPMDGNDHALDAMRYAAIRDDNTSSMPDAGLIGIYEID
jgi:phage terminase large subunit